MLINKLVDTSGTKCYSFPEIAVMRTLQPFNSSRSPIPIPTSHLPNSFGITSFAEPHPLNSVESYRYKNDGGQGVAPYVRTHKRTIPPSSLNATLTEIPLSVDSRDFTGNLSPLDATLTENRGEEHPQTAHYFAGVGRIWREETIFSRGRRTFMTSGRELGASLAGDAVEATSRKNS